MFFFFLKVALVAYFKLHEQWNELQAPKSSSAYLLFGTSGTRTMERVTGAKILICIFAFLQGRKDEI